MDLKKAQQGQIKHIWKTKPWIRQWAEKSSSCVLFLRGTRPGDEIVLSYIATRVIESAENVQPPSTLLVLGYYCGETRQHRHRAALAMMQSLLHQLGIGRQGLLLSSVPCIAAGDENIESGQTLLTILSAVMSEVPGHYSVICVIDGLNASFGGGSVQEARVSEDLEILRNLIAMVPKTQSSSSCRFKLLLTTTEDSVANRLAQQLAVGGQDIHTVDHQRDDKQGLDGSFWRSNRLNWA